MADHKPLPAVPRNSSIANSTNKPYDNARLNYTKLSLAARTHRSHLIRFTLSECAKDDTWVESNKEELVGVLEDVLDELGECVERGKWLCGIKTRVVLRARKRSRARESLIQTEALEELRQLAAKPDTPSGVSTCKHLLLCLAPLGSRSALPDEDSGFDIVPANIDCTFRSGCYVLDDEQGVLYGLEDWDSSIPTRLVGGTFTFKGVPSPTHHQILSRILKVSIYTHLSLLLEQHVLIDSHIKLAFAPPRVRTRTLTPPSLPTSSSDSSSKHRRADSHSIIPNRILNFFSRRSIGRANSPGSPYSPSFAFETSNRVGSLDHDVRSDAIKRLRKISTTSSSSHNTAVPAPLSPPISSSSSTPLLSSQQSPFSNTLARLESEKGLLSTSAGVQFEPPVVIVRLAEKEKRTAAVTAQVTTGLASLGSGLLGDERAALGSLLGWGIPSTAVARRPEDKDKVDRARGMTGLEGFVRHQHITVLVSSHVPLGDDTSSSSTAMNTDANSNLRGGLIVRAGAGSGTEATTSASTSTARSALSPFPSSDAGPSGVSYSLSTGTSNPTVYTACNEPGWVTYQYWRYKVGAVDGDGEQGSSQCRERERGLGRWWGRSEDESDNASESNNNDTDTDTDGTETETEVEGSDEGLVRVLNTHRQRRREGKKSRRGRKGQDMCLGEVLRGWIDSAEEECGNMRIVPVIPPPLTVASGSGKEDTTGEKDGASMDVSGSGPGVLGGTVSKAEQTRPSGSLSPPPQTQTQTQKFAPQPQIQQGPGGKKLMRCGVKKGRHERRFVHGGVRVSVKLEEVGQVEEVVDGGDERGGKRDEATSSTSMSFVAKISSAIPIRAASSASTNATDNIPIPSNDIPPDPHLRTYTSCLICGARTPTRLLSDGAYLFSWGKFLEVLIYAEDIGVVGRESSESGNDKDGDQEDLCMHTRSHSKIKDEASGGRGGRKERFNILRHFVGLASTSSGTELESGTESEKKEKRRKRKEYRVTFSLLPVEDIYEIRVPRVQIDPLKGFKVEHPGGRDGVGVGTAAAARTASGGGIDSAPSVGVDGAQGEDEKRKLRREIRDWWEGVGEFLDGLEDRLAPSTPTLGSFELGAGTDADTAKARKKKLPRLPSVDDDSDDDYEEEHEEELTSSETPRVSTFPNSRPNATSTHTTVHPGISGLPDAALTPREQFASALGLRSSETEEGSVTPKAASASSSVELSTSEALRATMLTSSSSSSSSSVSTSTSSLPPLQLLSVLRETLKGTEQSLYVQLGRTPVGSLNEVRRAFLCAARGVERRLDAWERKHFGKRKEKKKDDKDKSGKVNLSAFEPEWWDKSCHVVPGGNIIVREDDWGSIIAFTLSTPDYHNELANMTISRTASASASSSPAVSNPPNAPFRPLLVSAASSPAVSNTPNPPVRPLLVNFSSSSSSSSFLSAATATGYKLFRPSASASTSSLSLSTSSSTNFLAVGDTVNRDPDAPDVIWQTEPEAYSGVVTRKEHPRDPTSLLSLREVLRNKTPIGLGDATSGTGILSGSRFASLGKDTGRLLRIGTPPSAWAKPDVGISKQVVGGEVGGVGGMHELEVSGSVEGGGEARSKPSGSGSAFSSVYSWTTAASAGEDRDASHDRRGKGLSESTVDSDMTVKLVEHDNAPVPPPKNDGDSMAERPPIPSKGIFGRDIVSPISAKSSFSSLTSGLTNAVRLVLPLPGGMGNHNESARPQPKHHKLLSTADVAPIDERPHIKYDWTIGKRLKFSCTVYYAKQFDVLRKRCGIDEVFLKSLSRSTNWSAEGGKSKSNFWKTSDDRFIIKTLVNAWNVADLQVLIELGPSYFRYMDLTANKASVLAKLVGFYTVEVRNLESGHVQSKADLLVMENLFFDQKVDKTFDLKGIQGRKVKTGANANAQTSKTLFDGEWIEGQQQTLTLVRPYSKVILREAVRSDADFLARSNIMDYSLLLGVDTERKQIACGLVDTIGSYTFAKTLEYKAKQGLNAGKEVTVIPPVEYQERFVGALEKYFLACPDKWSRPLDDSKVISDSDLLPSVL